MSYILFKCTDTDIDIQKIRIKKPFVLYKKYEFDISYDEENFQFFIQTPICMLYKSSRYYSNIDNVYIDICSNNDNFSIFMKRIIHYITEKLQKCVPNIIKGKNFQSPFIEENTLRLRNKMLSDISVFDEKNTRID